MELVMELVNILKDMPDERPIVDSGDVPALALIVGVVAAAAVLILLLFKKKTPSA